MPTGQFESVYAVSSEDPAHPASNLLKIQSQKKWKCKEAGEKSAYVILQFDRQYEITGIDVGNEHSSFVSVSVGRRSYARNEFKEILITSSLMTPIESKNSTMTNRVRCFSANSLVKSVAREKWELVMAVCTQPFNRHVQYGLSFLTVHVAECVEPVPTSGPSKVIPVGDVPSTKPTETSFIGSLKLCEDTSGSDNESGPSLFDRWKLTRKNPISAIRAASQPTSLIKNTDAIKSASLDLHVAMLTKEGKEEALNKMLDRNRDDLLFREEDDLPNERLERKISEDQERIRKKTEKLQFKQKTKVDHSTPNITSTNSNSKSIKPISRKDKHKPTIDEKNESSSSKDSNLKRNESSRKRQSSPINYVFSNAVKKLKQDEKLVEYKPFNELLKGVVVAISGIQNPDRGILRQKTIDLGARYKADWDDGCTHLICAFKNTPKYNQAKKTGKVVTRHWIEKCYSLKKRLPWRRFALDEDEGDKPDSENEIHDISLKPPNMENDFIKTGCSSEAAACSEINRLDSQSQSDFSDNGEPNPFVPYGSDTEDDIERALAKQNVFEASTDEDETMRNPNRTTREPQLFDGLNFYLSNNLSASELHKVAEYIQAFRGIILDNASSADYIIANQKNELSGEFKGEFVSPLWVFECHDMECRIPTRRFLI